MTNIYKYFLLIVLLCNTTLARAQEDTLYYNKDWKETSRSNAVYYRFRTMVDSEYCVSDHYLNGNLQMKGCYTSSDTPDTKYRKGKFTYYFENGFKDNEGSYVNGKESDKWFYYFKKNNIVNCVVDYKDGKKDGPVIFYDSATQNVITEGQYKNGVRAGDWVYYDIKHRKKVIRSVLNDTTNDLDYVTRFDTLGRRVSEGKATFEDKQFGRWQYYYPETGKIKYEIDFVNDRWDGERISYFPNGAIRRKEVYSFGNMVKGQCFTEEGNETPYYKSKEEAKCSVDFKAYLKENLVYPEKAKKDKIMGNVVISFVINEDGNVSDAKVIKGIGGGCEKEAMRLLYSMPKWQPRMEEGKAVKANWNINIAFKPDQI